MYAQAGPQFHDELQRHSLPSSLVNDINARVRGHSTKSTFFDGIHDGFVAGEIKPSSSTSKKSSPKTKSSSRENSIFAGSSSFIRSLEIKIQSLAY
ncbi:hypothetical protein K1719_016093 [Acacia pycnantha]|nr:hypothetical protein K1719_016093 [Acacia pycnantha]